MKQIINGTDFRRLMISAAAAIEINKQKLNELNVFPVPDGDTGTNMSMTINAAANDLRKTEDPELDQAAKVAASWTNSMWLFSWAAWAALAAARRATVKMVPSAGFITAL